MTILNWLKLKHSTTTIHKSHVAAHFSLKKGKWVVSGVVVLCCLPFALLTTFLVFMYLL